MHKFHFKDFDYDMIEEVDQILDIYFWPAWAWYTAEAAYDFTLFGLAHMLKHGTTCSSNNYLWAEPTIRALSDSGARGIYFCGDYLGHPHSGGACATGRMVARQIMYKQDTRLAKLHDLCVLVCPVS